MKTANTIKRENVVWSAVKLTAKDGKAVLSFAGNEIKLVVTSFADAWKYVSENYILIDEDGNVVKKSLWERFKMLMKKWFELFKAGTKANWEAMKEQFKANKTAFDERRNAGKGFKLDDDEDDED